MRLTVGKYHVLVELGRPGRRASERGGGEGQVVEWRWSYLSQWATSLAHVAAWRERAGAGHRHLLIGLQAVAEPVLSRYWRDGRSLSQLVHDDLEWRALPEQLLGWARGRHGRRSDRTARSVPDALDALVEAAAAAALARGGKGVVVGPEDLLLQIAEGGPVAATVSASGLDLPRLRRAVADRHGRTGGQL
ncbi:MAG: hypothetical protein ACRD13_06340 [Terriglobales bacterium]